MQRNLIKTAAALLAGSTLALAWSAPVFAFTLAEVEARYTDAYKTCPGFASGVDPEMLSCISAEFEVQDKRLNAAYARALAALPASRKASLRQAQRTWIAYRDQWCDITYDRDSGSAERLGANSCGLAETILQTLKLEELAEYAEANR